MLRRIFHFLAGECVFSVPTAEAARAIDAVRSRGLFYSDMRPAGDTVRLTVPLLAAGKIRAALDAVSVSYTRQSRGLPHRLSRYRRRIGIPIGIVLLAAGIFVSSRYIWCFEITGNETMTAEEIVEGLTALGCGIGAKISDLVIDDIENEFALRSDHTAWISVNIKGTTARVEVREVHDGSGGEKKGTCANLIARESGEIVYLDISAGRAAVKAGDVVKEGELLASGVNASKSGKLRYEYAAGHVMARVTRLIHVEISPHTTEKVYTGRETTDRALNIFGKEINLFGKGGKTGANCDMIKTSEKFSFFRDETLPVHLTTRIYREYEITDRTVSEEEAVAAGLAELRRQMDEALAGAELLEKNITAGFSEGVYVIDCRLYVLTDIAETREVAVESDEEKNGAEGNQRAE